MRSLYDTIYNETFNRQLRWFLRQHTEIRLKKDDFIDYIINEVEWLLESMWMLIRINHLIPNEHINEFKKTFNEALIILDNTKLYRLNTRDNRKKAIYEWADCVDLIRDKRISVFADMRIAEEGIEINSQPYNKALNEFVDEFDTLVEAILNKDLEYVNTI